MKIAVSSNGNHLDSQIDPRFGRCAYFLIVNQDDMSFEAFNNESNALGGGAGIQAAQFVTSKGAKAVLTGHIGPNAVKALAAAGVEVFVDQYGSAREALERHKSGTLQSTRSPNVSDHYGMAGDNIAGNSGTGDSATIRGASSPPAPGRGMGGGRGRGLGGGRGRGMGGGRNRV